MSRKLALKRLKASDLSFFLPYLERFPNTKQKGFNLDSSLIAGTFFPSLKEFVEPLLKKAAHLDLTIFGPGVTEPDSLARKIKREAKNWRLNGEYISNPVTQPKRYDPMAPEDFVVLEFVGTIAPVAVKAVLVAATHPDDKVLYSALDAFFPTGSMRQLSDSDVAQIVAAGAPPVGHPFLDWLDKDLSEQVGCGEFDAIERINGKRSGRGMSRAELEKAKISAEEAGRLGEELLDYHFTASPHAEMQSYEWVADVNAIAPYDFLLNHIDGTDRHVDAKSTAGPFTNPIYLSLSEIHHAAGSGVPYHLFRLYNVNDAGATFRIARNIASRLVPVIDALKSLPVGVKATSLSFDPNYFDFGPYETIITYGNAAE